MNKDVLVIEDDEDIADGVRQVLEGEGYQVALAPNGREALTMLANAQQVPSVILLDLMMPVMNGYDFREAQLADPRIAAVPVVLMTADGHLTAKTARVGVAAAIGKPFDIEDLLAVVARSAR